jgi:hypothetical protein
MEARIGMCRKVGRDRTAKEQVKGYYPIYCENRIVYRISNSLRHILGARIAQSV